MRRIAPIAAALSAATALAGTASAATKTVSVSDDLYGPAAVTIKKGSTVTWAWHGQDEHNVTVRTGPVRFASPTQSSGTYSKRLTRAGLYRLYCTVHGAKMSMTVRVR